MVNGTTWQLLLRFTVRELVETGLMPILVSWIHKPRLFYLQIRETPRRRNPQGNRLARIHRRYTCSDTAACVVMSERLEVFLERSQMVVASVGEINGDMDDSIGRANDQRQKLTEYLNTMVIRFLVHLDCCIDFDHRCINA